ncbi:MAG: hypothetical protein Q9163_000074 [Psora crenata]
MTTETMDLLKEKLENLLLLRDYPKTICPSEVPRALTADELNAMGALTWRDLMPSMREIVWDLREKEDVEVLQKGKVIQGFVQLKDVKGPIRETPLPEYEGLYAVILDHVLTPTECGQLINAAEARTKGVWERAMVNIGNGKQVFDPYTRNCGRIIWDDRELVARIWARCNDAVPEIHQMVDRPRITGMGSLKRKEEWKLSRLNERMRFLKYGQGNYFAPHQDGSFATEGSEEISWITLHLYLNEPDHDSQLEGGATTFHSYDMERSFDVDPKAGRVLLFQHRSLLHSGAEVLGGVKYTMRTDIMYKKVDE